MGVGRSGGTWRKLKANLKAQRRDCHLCQQPINYTLPSTDQDSFSVDHIKPLSLHPELAEEPTNLAAAHLRCNKARGNRNARPDLGHTSRTW